MATGDTQMKNKNREAQETLTRANNIH